jgi:SAM-dependent methyltransferase
MIEPSNPELTSSGALRRDYTPLAQHYEARWQHFNALVREWVLEHWPDGLPAGVRVLELGCGTGGFLAILARRHPGLSLTGLDITPAMLDEARHAVPSAMLVEGSAESPPFRPASFDVVCSLNIMHHLDDPETHAGTMARLCRPGGTVFLCTFAGGATLAKRIADLWLRWRNPAWGGMLSTESVRAILDAERRLVPAESAILKPGAFWRLQIYRLSVQG